jgi:FtsP/CotA-like multicopper oxidase with cupredoxin domain
MSPHALEGMAGLVLGLHILPARKAPKPIHPVGEPRRLQLVAELLPGRYGKDPGFGFALQEGALAVPQGSASIPGPPLVLARGQAVSITVVNRLPEPTSVHWHGIELESYYDGIAGWSGSPGHTAPLIAPGSSFVAEFTPPRAGTFIYHTHIDDVRQLSYGLYGAIVVLEPGQSFDQVTDRIMLISVRGPTDNSSTLLNGSLEPEPIELRAGVKYRFRFINITPHDPMLTVSLLSGASPVGWRAIARDGADLPPAQATPRPAQQIISVGETYDFEFQPTSAGDLRLEIFRPARILYPESE